MKLNTAPQNSAQMGNVSSVGEFRIRNSAKAFNILSSGLYANKIRAIIRELSCNAVDSHTAAGCDSTPFDIHLPNQLEPWFSIRDYGIGLNHEQVATIYTTYFESTKTESNEFIGALGLGSKSPFSYTDNFTVTAIKDGVKGVYTAYINDQGIPSIVLMAQEATDEPSGVEVKFAVSNSYDYDKFRQEAAAVYTHFALRPVVTGNKNFKFQDVTYEDRDIIPGVHSTGHGASVAVMGNIAYPIQIPESDASFGSLRSLLKCGLELHFAIGELDFQASREGLSYVPMTLDSIRNKLVELNAALTVKLASEADAILNLWERALYLNKRRDSNLWRAAVAEYVRATKFVLFDAANLYPQHPKKFVDELEIRYNIRVRAVSKERSFATVKPVKNTLVNDKDSQGRVITREQITFAVDADTVFVINDNTKGGMGRVKYHWATAKKHLNGATEPYQTRVYLLEPAVRKNKMLIQAFFKDIYSPPAGMIKDITELRQETQDRASMGKVSILELVRRDSRRSDDYVWRNAGDFASFDAGKTYYYVPLNHFQCEVKYSSIKELQNDLLQSDLFSHVRILGVRKADIEAIKSQKNWINVEQYLTEELANIDANKMLGMIVDNFDRKLFDVPASSIKNANSPYLLFANSVRGVSRTSRYSRSYIESLLRVYGSKTNFSFSALEKAWQDRYNDVLNRYSMFKVISSYSVKPDMLVEYVNMVDDAKGVQ